MMYPSILIGAEEKFPSSFLRSASSMLIYHDTHLTDEEIFYEVVKRNTKTKVTEIWFKKTREEAEAFVDILKFNEPEWFETVFISAQKVR